MKINLDKYWELSDIIVKSTRDFNELEPRWNGWTTSGWRMMSDELLQEILTSLDIEVGDEN